VKNNYISLIFTLILFLTGCTHLIFQPKKSFLFDLSKTDVVYEDVFFRSDEGIDLHGWWFTHKTHDYKGTIVFLHGNAGNVSYHMGNAYWMVERGYDVLLFDYRGYGRSQGVTDLSGMVDDVDAAIGYALSRMEIKKVLVFAQSLGASVGVYAVTKSKFRKNILAYISVSAFSNYHKITQEVLSNSWLTWLFQWPLARTVNNDFSPIENINRVSPVPLLIAHSRDDEIIAYHHSLDLFQAAQEPKLFIDLKGKHNQVLLLKSNQNTIMEKLEQISSTNIR